MICKPLLTGKKILKVNYAFTLLPLHRQNRRRNSSMQAPTIGLFTGDPTGIGPEICVKVLSQLASYRTWPCVISHHRCWVRDSDQWSLHPVSFIGCGCSSRVARDK